MMNILLQIHGDGMLSFSALQTTGQVRVNQSHTGLLQSLSGTRS